jgi:hypothetical protein
VARGGARRGGASSCARPASTRRCCCSRSRRSPPSTRSSVHRLTPTVYRSEFIAALDAAAAARGRRVGVHLKLDTGMVRVGVRGRVGGALRTARRLHRLDVEGCQTHLARADEPSQPTTALQLARFGRGLEQLVAHGLAPSVVHVANTAGALVHADAWRAPSAACPDARLVVRPGIGIYGLDPGGEVQRGRPRARAGPAPDERRVADPSDRRRHAGVLRPPLVRAGRRLARDRADRVRRRCAEGAHRATRGPPRRRPASCRRAPSRWTRSSSGAAMTRCRSDDEVVLLGAHAGWHRRGADRGGGVGGDARHDHLRDRHRHRASRVPRVVLGAVEP